MNQVWGLRDCRYLISRIWPERFKVSYLESVLGARWHNLVEIARPGPVNVTNPFEANPVCPPPSVNFGPDVIANRVWNDVGMDTEIGPGSVRILGEAHRPGRHPSGMVRAILAALLLHSFYRSNII
jgi:hypothetical protein